MSRGRDNINFTFTLYSGQEAARRSTAASCENTNTTTEAPKRRLIRTFYSWKNVYEVLERALNSHSAQYSDLMYSGSVLILLEKSNDGVLYSVD